MALLASPAEIPGPNAGVLRILDQPDGEITSLIYSSFRRASFEKVQESAFLRNNESFAELRRRLSATSALQRGWDSYDAEPPNTNARVLAARILDVLEGALLSPTSLTPAVDGGIAMSFVEGGHRAVLEIYNTGDMAAATYSDDGEPVVWELDEANAVTTAKQIRVHLAA